MTTINKQEVLKLKEMGLRQSDIAKKLKTSRSRIEQITKGRINITPKQRETIFKRDNYKCQYNIVCNEEHNKKDLCVHHIDKDCSNNDTNNLITLCRYCHTHIHKLARKTKPCFFCGDNSKKHIKRKKKQVICDKCYKTIIENQKNRWSKKYNVCIKCGTNKTKYHSRGMCVTCYAIERYKNPKFKIKHRQACYKWNSKNIEKKRAIDKKAQDKFRSKIIKN